MTRDADATWGAWGGSDNARAKVLGNADGYLIAFVEAEAGYRGTPHEHAHAEFFYLLDGRIRNQGDELTTSDDASRA